MHLLLGLYVETCCQILSTLESIGLLVGTVYKHMV